MKTNNSYTPGPWTFRAIDEECNQHHLFDNNGSMLAQVILTPSGKSNSQADVRLMSCGPEMLELLKETLDYGKTETGWSVFYARVKSVIAKAEGRP